MRLLNVVFLAVLLSANFIESQSNRMTCQELGRIKELDETYIIGDWNLVFVRVSRNPYHCLRVKIRNITERNIEDWKKESNYSATIPIQWDKVKFRVRIYNKTNKIQDMALQEINNSGQFYALRIPDFFKYFELMISMPERVAMQLNIIKGYLIAMSCDDNLVTIHSKIKPDAGEILNFVNELGFMKLGVPVCVRGAKYPIKDLKPNNKIVVPEPGKLIHQEILEKGDHGAENLTVIYNLKEL